MCLRRREGETNAIESDVTSIANTHAVLCPPTHRSIPHKQPIVFQVIVGLYHDDLWANPGGDTEKLEEAVKQRDGADAKVAAKAAAGAKGGRKSATKSGDRVAALRNSGKKRGKKSGNNGGKKDRGHAEEAANEAVAAVAAAAAAVAAGMVASENKDEEGDAGEDEEGRGMRVLGSMDEDDMVNLMDEDDPFCKDNAASADATVATVAAVGVDQPPKLVAVAKASAVVESTSTAVTASHGEVGEGGRGGGTWSSRETATRSKTRETGRCLPSAPNKQLTEICHKRNGNRCSNKISNKSGIGRCRPFLPALRSVSDTRRSRRSEKRGTKRIACWC